jgi:hypothetical protein
MTTAATTRVAKSPLLAALFIIVVILILPL